MLFMSSVHIGYFIKKISAKTNELYVFFFDD
jgi:hypothetical protein